MSTKIYSGFKFNTSNFGDVQAYVNNWRSRIGALALEKANKRLALRVVTAIDKADVRSALTPDLPIETLKDSVSPLFVIRKEMRDQAREDQKNGYRNIEMDFDFEVDLIYNDGAFYGVVRTDQSDWIEAWVSSDRDVSDYSYWDNCDHPDDVSDDEWLERGETWEKLLKDSKWRPAYAGFTCVIHNSIDTSYRMGQPDEVVFFQPDFEDRLSTVVEMAFADRHMTFPETANFDASWFMKERSRVMKMLRSEDHAEEVAELTEACREILRPRISENDLTSNYEPNPYETGAQGPTGP